MKVNSSKIFVAFISVHGMTVCNTVTNKIHNIATCSFTLLPFISIPEKSRREKTSIRYV